MTPVEDATGIPREIDDGRIQGYLYKVLLCCFLTLSSLQKC